tara:strand:+ start:357 stop:905 length:549 start_codon:yes stop_codon:yes gene_type:complete
MTSTIYSIGHGNKKIEDFISELEINKINFLLDIRSKPYSKWNPQFNQNQLNKSLHFAGIKYVFVGDVLGGLPDDKTCYDRDGKVIYDIIKRKDFFKNGLRRITSANSKKVKLVIMCSETKPEECHRSKLIGQELLNKGISLNHIVSKKVIKPQQLVMNELNKGKNIINLFGEEKNFTSRKAY